MNRRTLTRLDLQKMKESEEPVVWLTAYDFPTAQFAEEAGMNMLLVGDSLGMCVYGYSETVPVTMYQCIWHCDAVRRIRLSLVADARAIQATGAFALLVEAVPPEVCKIIRDELTIH
ncbi:MAG: 3-methyl-2-oxobutanoate hydroxymethyltransferase [Desulfobacterales bacterium]|nr:MAG: 3-methyl-2-oxobutanoate hydroxymethyltransferase [Desulfobacterales bacterium]